MLGHRQMLKENVMLRADAEVVTDFCNKDRMTLKRRKWR
jgi:hypothetical protein